MLNDLIELMGASPQHSCFYHFTDRRNLPSINHNGGILSMRELRRREIGCQFPGGNEWSLDADRMCGVDAYVHLCFTTGHPMEYLARQDGRIENSAWLRIDPNVIKLPGVKICDEVSNKSGAVLRDAAAAIPIIDLEVIYTRTDWKDPNIQQRLRTAEKYEVLVPRIVPINYVQNPNG